MKYFTADPHLQHDGVLQMCHRPFDNIDEHDKYLIDSYNRDVGKKDSLYFLGDVAWRTVDNFLDRLVCKNVHLIIGNHDKANYSKKFLTAADTAELKLMTPEGETVKAFLSHYPHMYWPSSHNNSLHLYGHVHAQREEFLNALFPQRRAMDVGVDAAKRYLGDYKAFSEVDICKVLLTRTGHDNPDYYQKIQQDPTNEFKYTAEELRKIRFNIDMILGIK